MGKTALRRLMSAPHEGERDTGRQVTIDDGAEGRSGTGHERQVGAEAHGKGKQRVISEADFERVLGKRYAERLTSTRPGYEHPASTRATDPPPAHLARGASQDVHVPGGASLSLCGHAPL